MEVPENLKNSKVLDNLSLSIAFFDAKTYKFLGSNRAFWRLTQGPRIKPADVELGLCIFDFFKNEDRSIIEKFIEAVSDIPFVTDFNRQVKLGHRGFFPAEIWIRFLTNDDSENIALVLELVDISVQKLFEELGKKKKEVDRLLCAISDALIVVDSNLTLAAQCSDSAKTLFKIDDFEGKTLQEVLCPFLEKNKYKKDYFLLESFVICAFELFIPEQFKGVASRAPQQIRYPTNIECTEWKSLVLSYSPIIEDGIIKKIIILLQDQTELVHLKENSSNIALFAALESLETLTDIIKNQKHSLGCLITEGSNQAKLMDKVKDGNLHEVQSELRRTMHTIKGGARTLRLKFIETFAHITEQSLDDIKKMDLENEDKEELVAKLMASGKSVQDALNNLRDICAVNENGSIPPNEENTWNSFVNSTMKWVKELANDLEKQVKISIILSGSTPKPSEVDFLSGIALHMFRNSLDHGIEKSVIRAKIGKTPYGNLKLFVDNQNDDQTCRCTFSDDGCGIDPTRIREKAQKLELISEENKNELTLDEILNIITVESFSVKDEVNLVSGRGIGMDYVASVLKEKNGTIKLLSNSSNGIMFEITWQK